MSSHCVTCGDVVQKMRVLEIHAERRLALCADGAGRRETVETALVEPVGVGEGLLVHAGTAIAKLEPEEPRA
jgi:hydrogenase maturation factor